MSEQESKVQNGGNNESLLSEDMRILEALLFASDEILSSATLKGLLPGEPDARAVRKLVASVNSELQKQRHPFEIVELGGGYQFRTIAYYRPFVGKLLKEKTVKKLSLQALECLAIIAYKQPITKAEIEAIRGVISDGAMKTLLERHMITIVGRSDKPGRPLLYGTSKEFLEYFGINKLSDLPRIEEFEAMAREKMEQLSEEEQALIESAPDEEELMAQPEGVVVTNETEGGGQEPAAAQQTQEALGASSEEPVSEDTRETPVENTTESEPVDEASQSGETADSTDPREADTAQESLADVSEAAGETDSEEEAQGAESEAQADAENGEIEDAPNDAGEENIEDENKDNESGSNEQDSPVMLADADGEQGPKENPDIA